MSWALEEWLLTITFMDILRRKDLIIVMGDAIDSDFVLLLINNLFVGSRHKQFPDNTKEADKVIVQWRGALACILKGMAYC